MLKICSQENIDMGFGRAKSEVIWKTRALRNNSNRTSISQLNRKLCFFPLRFFLVKRFPTYGKL